MGNLVAKSPYPFAGERKGDTEDDNLTKYQTGRTRFILQYISHYRHHHYYCCAEGRGRGRSPLRRYFYYIYYILPVHVDGYFTTFLLSRSFIIRATRQE
eukprot:gene3941-2804_t